MSTSMREPHKRSWPGVQPGTPEHSARMLAAKLRERLAFSSEHLEREGHVYVAWLDLTGAGNAMSTSVHRTANAIARLHLSVFYATKDHAFVGTTLPINDGIFLLSSSKKEIMSVIRSAILLLVGNFVARPNDVDRFLFRGALAYGPIYFGSNLNKVLEKKHIRSGAFEALNRIAFGPPIIQAYRSENAAPPYGIAVHESARAFSPPDEEPFRTAFWFWWQNNDDGTMPRVTPGPILPLKEVFGRELEGYFDYLSATASIHNLETVKIEEYRRRAKEYFTGYGDVQRRKSTAERGD